MVGTIGQPTGHAGLLRVPLDGGAVVDLAAPLDRNVMPGGPGYPGALPQLVRDGKTVLFCVRDRGCTHVYSVPSTGGAPAPGRHGRRAGTWPGMSVAGDAAADRARHAGLARRGRARRPGHPRARRSAPGTARTSPRSSCSRARSASSRSPTALSCTAGSFATRPGTGPQPLLLDIHGGPHNAWNGAADQVHLYHQELAARGWTVLLLNPRAATATASGSSTRALGAWGEADARDFLEPIDELVAAGVADPARLAVTGYSYGGYMTCYLTSRDDRFAAAVAGGVVSDLASMAGTSDAGHFLSEYELSAAVRGPTASRTS